MNQKTTGDGKDIKADPRTVYDYLAIFRPIEDVFEAATVPMVFGKEAGKLISEEVGFHHLDEVELLLPQKSMSDYAERVFEQNLGRGWREFERDGIKFKIRILTRNYSFMQYPDSKFYFGALYSIPNPFDKYWKVRWIVQ